MDIVSLKDGIEIFKNLDDDQLNKNSLEMFQNIRLKFIGSEYKKTL